MKTKYFRIAFSFILLCTISISSCAKKAYGITTVKADSDYSNIISNKAFKNAHTEMDTIIGIENVSQTPAKKILSTGRKMALDDRSIIPGSCWNWVNEVFNKAGYGVSKQIVFKSRKGGPYAKPDQIKPGDWLYYINYSYRGIEHSGIFVYWKDFEKKIGVILSYGGRNRKEPARYLSYNLKSVYYITRASEK